MKPTFRVLLGLMVLLLAWLAVGGCGSSGRDFFGQNSAAAGLGYVPIPSGQPGGSAVASLADFRAAPVDDSDILGDVLLTRLTLVLKPDATLGDLQRAAQKVGALGLSFSRQGSIFLDLAVPRQADFSALNELAGRLQGEPGIVFAGAGRQFQTFELPPTGGPPVDTIELFHTLATRFPAAWNLRHLAESSSSKASVVVSDFFGGARVRFDVQMEGSTSGPTFVPASSGRHGFQVAGTLAARFDSLQSHGANPVPQKLAITLDQTGGITQNQGLDQIFTKIEEVRSSASPVIVNLSMGYNNQISASLFGNRPEDVRARVLGQYLLGLHWAQLTSNTTFADRVMLVVAAGNDRGGSQVVEYPGLQNAQLSSPFAIAAISDRLEDFATDPNLWNPPSGPLGDLRLQGQELTDLLATRDSILAGRSVSGRNLVLVGSVDFKQRLDSLAASTFSNNGAQLFAIGEGVSTIAEDGATGSADSVDGTSFSAPQVAGLASYLWLLDDTLKAQPVEKTLQLMKATSRSNAQVANIVDAYGAVMALDARRSDRRMRKELLDVSGPAGVPDSLFNEFDLQKFEQVYDLRNPAGAADPNIRDYSRHDLNGDGFTGGTKVDRFDLDAAGLDGSGAPIFSSLQIDVEGSSVTFNEASLSDLDILKYYAYVTGPSGQPLFYDTSSANALSERQRIFGGEQPLLDVTVLGRPDGSETNVTD